jgi:ribosome biogenesis protein MAK21
VPPVSAIDALYKHGEMLLEQENARYSETHMKSSQKFFMSSGTLDDRISALTLLAQESPLHTMKAFENLVGLAKKKSRNQALMALSALKDLLGQGVILPPDRKLRAFAKQPGLIAALQGKAGQWTSSGPLPGGLKDVHLVLWAYEDWLKRSYFDLLKVLETWCNDEIPYARSRAITYVWELLKEKPEQEENLLRLLVNKLGDKDRKIASRASYLLLQLQVTHPVMKSVIIGAIEAECLFRPGQNAHARYYAVITLNQTVLSGREQEVANKLLDIYFALFVALLKTTEKGQNPHAVKDTTPQQGGGGKPGRKARQKQIQQEKTTEAEVELNDKVIAQVLTGVNRAYPFANTEGAHFDEQLDMLFRITHSANFNTSVQAMMLIQQISASKHHSADRYYRVLYESLLDARLLTTSKQILYLNLLYRSLKADVNVKRVQAFTKRLLQTVTLHEPAFACGVLYLVHELQRTFPGIKSMLEQPEAANEEDEHFVDVDDGLNSTSQPNGEVKHRAVSQYDGRKRDPEFSNAHKSCLWELVPFQAHFHPSVQLFASRLLYSQDMPAKPDPSLHTVMHFLDRFIYRNAKTKTDTTRGASVMQPLAGSAAADLLIKKRDGSRTEIPLNNEAFWLKKSEEVAADEVFFHQYFNQSKKKQTTKDRAAGKDRDAEDSGDEQEIWKALVDSRPELEDADEDEEGFSDLEDLQSDDDEDEAADEEDKEDAGVELHGFDEAEQDEDITQDSDGFDATQLDSEEDAFMDSDDEVPVDVPADVGDGTADTTSGQGKASKFKERKDRRKKLKQLPTFASVEDYAKLLEEDDALVADCSGEQSGEDFAIVFLLS